MIKGEFIVKGSYQRENIKVEKVEELGSYIRIVGSTYYSKEHIDQVLKKEDLNKLEIIERGFDFSSDPKDVFFVIEATRFQYASLFDPQLIF